MGNTSPQQQEQQLYVRNVISLSELWRHVNTSHNTDRISFDKNTTWGDALVDRNLCAKQFFHNEGFVLTETDHAYTISWRDATVGKAKELWHRSSVRIANELDRLSAERKINYAEMNTNIGQILDVLDRNKEKIPDADYISAMNALRNIRSKLPGLSSEQSR